MSAMSKEPTIVNKSVNAIPLLTLLGGGHNLLLREVLKLSDLRTNRFHSDKDSRALIMKRLDIPEVTYQRQLKWLTEKEILLKHGRGVYSLNPKILSTRL